MALKPVTLGKKTATSGTPVSLGTLTLAATYPNVNALIIQALKTNTGYVYVGDSTTSKTGPIGHALSAGESFVINGLDRPAGMDEMLVGDYYIDVATSGEGVMVTATVRK